MSSPRATRVPPVERDGNLAVAGEAVEADEGTGFRRTISTLGTVNFGRFEGGVEVGGWGEEESRREGRPRSITVHFSGPLSHCTPISAVVKMPDPQRSIEMANLAQFLCFDKKKEAPKCPRPQIADLSRTGSRCLISLDLRSGATPPL